MPMNQIPSYLESLREGLPDNYEFTQANFRRVLDVLDNALHYIAQMDKNAHATQGLIPR